MRISPRSACLVAVLGGAALAMPAPESWSPAAAELTGGAGSAVLLGQGNDGGHGGPDAEASGFGAAVVGGSFIRPPAGGGAAAAVAAPAMVAVLLTRGAGLCSRVPEEYLTDCIATLFREAASLTPQYGAYSDAYRVLDDAATRLDQLVSANVDPDKPPIRLRTGGGGSSPRMRAVRPGAVAQVNAAAATILAETETVLLRSPVTVAARQDYARIAEAVGSNKLLLRS